jgi:hypothetical protein
VYTRRSLSRAPTYRSTGQAGSGCASFVAMVQPADLGDSDYATVLGVLHWPRERGVFHQRQVRACLMVMGDERSEMSVQAFGPKHDYMVQASRRIVPITRSTYERCQGERGADKTCSIPNATVCSRNSWR